MTFISTQEEGGILYKSDRVITERTSSFGLLLATVPLARLVAHATGGHSDSTNILMKLAEWRRKRYHLTGRSKRVSDGDATEEEAAYDDISNRQYSEDNLLRDTVFAWRYKQYGRNT